MDTELIIPTEIPWNEIKGKDLEELLYWLFHSMGAKDLEWRIGGKGAGTSDQGRDLELSFYQSAPDGNFEKQQWWVEAKGRKGTVESIEVKEAVINVSGNPNIDIIVVATNTNFSNPTRDWVKEWQKTHPRPIVKLWERIDLEKLCSKNPIAVIRLYSKALSDQGSVEVVKSKFWDYVTLTGSPILRKIWDKKLEIAINDKALLALVVSEIANGDITKRSWCAYIDDNLLFDSFSLGLINFTYLLSKALAVGSNPYPIIKAFSYMTLVCINRLGPSTVIELFKNVWINVENYTFSEEQIKTAIELILDVLHDEIRDVCKRDCQRIHSDNYELKEVEVEKFWDRLKVKDKPDENKPILTIIAHTNPCKVGIKIEDGISCPIDKCHDMNKKLTENFEEFINTIDRIIKTRN